MSLPETQLLVPGSSVLYYARACALSEEWAFVGHPNAADGGKVYIYKWDPVSKQFPTSPTQTLNCPGGGNQQFGAALAVSGSRLLVGAPYATNGAVTLAGLVYAYAYNSSSGDWESDGTLKASDPATGDYFGTAVAIDDDVAAVGVHITADAAYVFIHTGSAWPTTEDQILVGSDTVGGNRFGVSVAVSKASPDSKTRILVGAPYHNHQGFFYPAGAAYMFASTGSSPPFAQEDELNQEGVSEPAAWYNDYGKAVALNGDTALVGATGTDDGGGESGSAYVHKRSGSDWPQFKKLMPRIELPGSSESGGYAGRRVAFDGIKGIVGAPGAGDAYPGGGVTNTGRAFLYDAPDFGTPQALIPAAASANDRWGFAVATYGGIAAFLGGYADDTAGTDWGAASFWGELPEPPGLHPLLNESFEEPNVEDGSALWWDEGWDEAGEDAADFWNGGRFTPFEGFEGAWWDNDLSQSEFFASDLEAGMFEQGHLDHEPFEFSWASPMTGPPWNHQGISEFGPDTLEVGSFDSGSEDHEDFEESWDDNEDSVASLDDASISVGMFDSAAEAYENFENLWQDNEDSISGFTDPDPTHLTVGQFDTTLDSYEDFEEEWSTTLP